MSDDAEDDKPKRKTGYKSPPEEHQFKKGNKGNPWGCKGKPRPTRAFLDEQVTLKIDGRKVRMTRAEAIEHALFKEAMNGNVSAAKRLEERRDREAASKATDTGENAIPDQDAAALERFIQRQLKERVADTKGSPGKRQKRHE